MFRLSKAAEYAIRGLVHLSVKQDNGISDIEEISRAQDVPQAFLSKVFQILVKKGFVKSFRGPEGGFSLAVEPREITLLDVIEAVEGPIFLNDCLVHKGACPRDEYCPVHEIWQEAQKRFLDYMKSCTFDQLVDAVRKREESAGPVRKKQG